MMLIPSITALHHLSGETREHMLALHTRHFAAVRRDRFLRDLAEKDWVILLHAHDGTLAGFSTQQLLSLDHEGQPVRFLFSGDTIVDRAHWNTPLLAGCFGHLMLRLMAAHGEDHLYWFLISKGFRTYRFLPVFFHRFWPAPDRETPADMAALLHAISHYKFGDGYDRQAGVVRTPHADRLLPDLADVPPARRQDPHVAYFLARNPGFARGDELACLAPIRNDNLNAYAQRVIRSTAPEWQC
jgi:hypothetical protein